MAHALELQRLLDQFALSIGLTDLQLNEEGLCALRFSGKVTVEISADGDNLLIYSELGAVEPGREKHIYPTLLQANLFWNSTYGATLSITDDHPARVILALSCNWTRQTAVQFEELMEKFVSAAEHWMTRLQQRPDNGDVSSTEPSAMQPLADPRDNWDMLRG